MSLPTLLKAGFMKGFSEIAIDAILKIVFHMINGDNIKYKNKVMILKATTGTGKSTVLPAFLSMKLPKMVISSQPRVINAKSLPAGITKYYPFILGKNIGYQTGVSQNVPETGIIFVTNGILVNSLLNLTDDEICKKYSVILLDEAHELDELGINMHYFFKLFALRNKHRRDCPIIIITSATFDYNHFAQYYQTDIILKVKGFTFPIAETFIPYTSKNYLKDIVDIIENINNKPLENSLDPSDDKAGDDIIVFFAGISDIKDIQVIIEKRNINITVLILNREVSNAEGEDFKKLFLPAFHFKTERKVILSTNAGETGITLPYVKHVIDSGFYKPRLFLPDKNVYLFEKQPSSFFAAKQRKGRVGRITPGYFYGVYTEDSYKKLRTKLLSSFYYSDLTIVILNLLEKHSNIIDMDLIYKPAVSSMWYSLEKLYILGFIKPDLTLTNLGFLTKRMPRLNIEQIKILLSGYVFGAPIQDLIIITIMISEDTKNIKKTLKPEYKSSLFVEEAKCDFIPCIEYFNNDAFDDDMLSYVCYMRDIIIEALANLGFNPYANSEISYPNHPTNYFSVLKQCIYEGLKLNICTWNGQFYEDIYGNKIYQAFCGTYFVYSILQYKIQQDTDINKSLTIYGKTVLDHFINVATDFF